MIVKRYGHRQMHQHHAGWFRSPTRLHFFLREGQAGVARRRRANDCYILKAVVDEEDDPVAVVGRLPKLALRSSDRASLDTGASARGQFRSLV